MNAFATTSRIAIALAAVLTAGTALAQAQSDAAPARTRAQVIAELVAARANGELAAMHQEKGVDVQALVGTKTSDLPAHAVLPRTRVTAEEIAEAHAANGERELGNFEPVAPRKARELAGR